MPAPQDVRKKGSEILKLPPVRSCFTLTMTNKLVVIINSLKYQKLRTFYCMQWNFLYIPHYSCLQNPWLGGYRPQIPVLSVLCPQLNLLNPPTNKIPGYATETHTRNIRNSDTEESLRHWRWSCFAHGALLNCGASDQGLWAWMSDGRMAMKLAGSGKLLYQTCTLVSTKIHRPEIF